MSDMNTKRALWAAAALKTFQTETGTDTDEETISDLIADIGHYCDAMGLDYLKLMAGGIGVWKLEQADPESMGIVPSVSIKVVS